MENHKLRHKVLIIEDQLIIALMIEDAIIAAGFDVVGMAASKKDAALLMDEADIALVDVNLSDGPTGPEIGAALAAAGKTVVFMTGNPEQVARGDTGALGVISKPVDDEELTELIKYVAAHRAGTERCPPRNLKLFTET